MCILQKKQTCYLWKTWDERKAFVCSGNCRGNRSNFRSTKASSAEQQRAPLLPAIAITDNPAPTALRTLISAQEKALLVPSRTTNTAPAETRKHTRNKFIFCSLSTDSSSIQLQYALKNKPKRACWLLTCPGTRYTHKGEAQSTWKQCHGKDCQGPLASLAVRKHSECWFKT